MTIICCAIYNRKSGLKRLKVAKYRGEKKCAQQLKDVAKLAGVSTATVSNVLTGRKNVSESLRRRVNEASAELDYKPNSIARSLKTNQSHTIGVIVPDILNPFFAEVLKHIGYEASRKDYQVVMYESGEKRQTGEKAASAINGKWS